MMAKVKPAGHAELVEALRKKNLYLEKELNRAQVKLHKSDTSEGWTQKIVDAIRERDDYIKPLSVIKPKIVKGDAETMNLLLSDLHAGEQVDLEEMGGLNEYNLNIMKRRLERIKHTVIRILTILSSAYSFEQLKVYGLGDWISGIIHEELVETSDGNVIDWLFETSEAVAGLILTLSARFPKTTFVGVVGNHGRMQKQIRYKQRYVNWDYVCYDRLKLLCSRDEKVDFVLPKSFFHVDRTYNKSILVIHGDNINSWAGIPWYGIQRQITKLKELMAKRRQFIDYTFMGHFHNTGMLEQTNGEIILNGSLIGANEFSAGAMFQGADPHQWIFGMHPRKGITFRYSLAVED